MKILFISDVYFPRVNGVSTSIETFRRNLRAQGHTVHLIVPDYQKETADEAGVTRVPSRQIPFDPEDRLMNFKWVMQQLDKLRAEQYDVIHVQTPFVAHYLGIKLSKLLDIPCVETYHTFFEEYLYHYIPIVPKKIMQKIAQRFSRHQGNSLDGMVVPSHPMLHILRQYGVTSQAEVIPTGIEPASFVLGDREAFRNKHGIPKDQPVLLFVGRVAHEKNIGFLLKVVEQVSKQIPNVLFVIAGEGPAKVSLEQEVSQLGIQQQVKFIGYLDRNTELNSCYRSADIFIFSSRTETQGLVLLEAMAQGVPVVSTAELGTKDVLCDGLGVWIAKEELNEFSQTVVKLLGDAGALERLSASGREYAHGWSASKQAERMVAFYQSVLAPSKIQEMKFELSTSAVD
ncbi:MAG: glycosyltransferase [Gallionellaceae bacterium]